MRDLPLLRRAQFKSQPEVNAFILDLFKLLDPGVVYEFNQDAHWELDDTSAIRKEMFSACAVTLGKPIEDFIDALPNEDKKAAALMVALEFLKTAVLFVADLIKQQAEKEECETLDLQYVYLPPFVRLAAPKMLREAVVLEKTIAAKALPLILDKINAGKIDVSFNGEVLSPRYSALFLVPWQKKTRRKGKK